MTSFFTERANRPFTIHGRTYKFEPVAFIAGNFNGVLTVDGQAEIDLLEAASKRMGVQVIPEEEANQLRGKAKPTGYSSPSSDSPTPRQAEPAKAGPILSETARGVVRSAESATEKTMSVFPAELPEPQDIIRIDRVAPPQMILDDSQRIGGAVEKTPKKRKSK